MANVIFWSVFFGLCLVLIIANYNKSRAAEIKKYNEITEGFANVMDISEDSDINLNTVSGYYDYVKTADSSGQFYIDDITWNDLNMNSVFTLMNRTLSSCGEEVLFSRLHTLYHESTEPNRFYDDMEMLAENDELRNNLIKRYMGLGKTKSISSYRIIEKLFGAKSDSVSKNVIIVGIIIVCFVLMFIIPAWGLVLFLISLFAGINTYFKDKAGIKENIRAFCYCIRLLRCADAISELLPEEEIINDKRIRELSRGAFLVPSKDGTTSNPFSIIYDYLMMIFHIDIIVFKLRMNAIIQNQDLIRKIYYTLGYYDAVISVASFVHSQDYFCKAELKADSCELVAKDLYHPLNRNPVCNDIEAKRSILITGSNASGKSTFLKMTGIATIFANGFGFALATKFVIGFFDLYSSMALNDNILGEESYYVVESKSLKRICDAADGGHKVMCIVDEVLRGTNTTERIAASCKILDYLAKKNALCFVATHDTELTYLLEHNYDNYYFTEEVNENSVSFPYKIFKGVSTTGNAIKLLRSLGYDENITKEAELLVEKHSMTGKWENN